MLKRGITYVFLAGLFALVASTTQEEIFTFQSYVPYSADAYCSDLKAGDRIGDDGTVLWVMGSGTLNQMVYLAHSPTLGIVVSHEGTNLLSLESISDDLKAVLVQPFPLLRWLGSDVMISNGFQQAWNDTASEVLYQVKRAKRQFPNAPVSTTGHSLGATTALLDAMYLQQAMNMNVDSVVFGLPRMGNPAFANAVDRNLSNFHRITHYREAVPHLPTQELGYRHPSGEVWLANESGTIVYECNGQEDPNCADGVVVVDISDHNGPYFGTSMYCSTGGNPLISSL